MGVLPLTPRDFLLRFPLMTGVGRHSALVCWRWLVDHPQLLPLTPETLDYLLAAVNLPAKRAMALRWQVFSADLARQVTTSLTQCRAVTLADTAYPALLKEIYEPPVVLYFQGRLDLVARPQLAVVGSRHPTTYAFTAMRQLLPAVSRQGVCLISGLAQGVDTLAHQVALAHGGATIAVVGTGLGRCYPAQNRALMDQLSQTQLVVSEYPWNAKGAKHHFVERNRIISGLCQSVLVVEAAHHSGSLITANFALQENRNVLAVPGNIDGQNSVGTNELILAGAKPILNSEHIMEELLVDKRP
ncbi:DNA-processing protein DprA [Levilactobacillus zymae]|uniref:DNA-processing protein DprA n=1 Tax=Levilactobacillus zymae TaxID=267363 RepID=UPI001E3F1FE1|nr:DNA-processing protein DprA [Levilactobacillus zymae]